VKHQKIFWRHCRGTSRRIAHKKVFITNLCKRLRLGRLHLCECHLVILDLQSTLFLFCYCLAYHFYFSVCILFTTFYFGWISCGIILLSVFILKTKKHKIRVVFNMYAKLWKATLNINQLRKETKCVDFLKILEEWLFSFVSHMK
jgi:hypothetical protein